MVRADSAFYAHSIVAAARRAGARFSLTARHTRAVLAAIAGIPETAWAPIRYRDAIFDEHEQRWISEAEVAEVPFTAFTSRRQREHVSARLIVRRVRRLNPEQTPAGEAAQGGGETASNSAAWMVAALDAAGVELGAFDRFVVAMLAREGWSFVQAAAGWVTRAHRGGDAHG